MMNRKMVILQDLRLEHFSLVPAFWCCQDKCRNSNVQVSDVASWLAG